MIERDNTTVRERLRKNAHYHIGVSALKDAAAFKDIQINNQYTRYVDAALKKYFIQDTDPHLSALSQDDKKRILLINAHHYQVIHQFLIEHLPFYIKPPRTNMNDLRGLSQRTSELFVCDIVHGTFSHLYQNNRIYAKRADLSTYISNATAEGLSSSLAYEFMREIQKTIPGVPESQHRHYGTNKMIQYSSA